MIELLGELAVDVDEPIDAENPLRQVIINTHSPSVVACVQDDALLVAHAGRGTASEASRLSVRHLPDTWRCEGASDEPTVTRGDLLGYLNPLEALSGNDDESWVGGTDAAILQRRAGRTSGSKRPSRRRKVMDREDLRQPSLLAVAETGPEK